MVEKHFLQILAEETPSVNKAFFDLVESIEKDSGLDAKTVQLVYIGISAHKGVDGAVAAHAGYAKKAGATRDEVRGAVLVSLITTGVAGISSCLAAALNAYDNA